MKNIVQEVARDAQKSQKLSLGYLRMQVDRPSSLCQDDFDGLAVPDLQQDGCSQTLVDYEKFAGSSDAAKSGKCACDDYVPQNFIKDEVLQFIAAFERTTLQRAAIAQAGDAMETATGGEDFEPLRPLTDRAPPKRFYLTFWRSAAWRLVQQKQISAKIEFRRTLSSSSNGTIQIS
jgi:hypothetical protein